MATRNVFYLIYNDVEILDFTGPFDVFSMANMMSPEEEEAPFNLNTVAIDRNPIKTAGGLEITPMYGFADDLPKMDALIIPGAPSYQNLNDFDVLTAFIRQNSGIESMVSICVGASLLLSALGPELDGHKITTHHGAISYLEEMAAEIGVNVEVVPGVRYLDSNGIYSSGGVSAGMDLAFYLVEKFLGAEMVQSTAQVMEYNRTINWGVDS